MNQSKLRGRMIECGYTQEELAAKAGMCEYSLSRKLNGKRDFRLREVIAICKALKIKNPANYFF